MSNIERWLDENSREVVAATDYEDATVRIAELQSDIAEHKTAITILAGQLTGAVYLLDALDSYAGHRLGECSILSGAPDCDCGFDELYTRVRATVRGAVPRDQHAKGDLMTTGGALIEAERQRQIGVEGWTPEHDDRHRDGEMAQAAAVYAWPNNYLPEVKCDGPVTGHLVAVANLWPWERESFKPCMDDRVRELVKAGALIAAEIDRLQRALPLPRTNLTKEDR